LAVSDRREVAKRRADMRDQADSPSPLQEGVWAFGRMENALNVNEPLACVHRNFAHTQRAGVEELVGRIQDERLSLDSTKLDRMLAQDAETSYPERSHDLRRDAMVDDEHSTGRVTENRRGTRPP